MKGHGRAYAALFVSALGWALAPVFIRYLSAHYDPYTQSFVRYVSAAAALVPWCVYRYPKELRRALVRWRTLAGIALLVVFMQTAWTVAIYHTTATAAQLICKLQVPMVILMSYLVFREERFVILSFRFLGGTALALAGVTGVLMRDPSVRWFPALDLAFALLMFVNVCWSVYIVGSRHTCKDLHPVPMFTVVAVMVSVGFLPVMLIKGDTASIGAAGAWVGAVAFLSGMVSISMAHCAFHYAQVRLGAAFCTSLQLANPLATYLVALFLWADEELNALQWAGAVVLVLGSILVVDAQRRAGRALPPADVNAAP
jgi:drug/metabolite transporter (DMT)-like permease